MRAAQDQIHHNGYLLSYLPRAISQGLDGGAQMDMKEYWNAIAPLVLQQCEMGLENMQPIRQELDALSEECGALLLVHRMGDKLPFYISPSVDSVLEGASNDLTADGLLRFLSEQHEPLHQAWRRFKEHVVSGASGPHTTALLVDDAQGRPLWLAGSCGVVGTDAEGNVLAMGLFFYLDRMGPVPKDSATPTMDTEEMLDRLRQLTPREREVLELILAEYSIPEICQKLSVSKDTVHSHRKNLQAKLGTRTRLGLTMFIPLLKKLNGPFGNSPT
jgi:DNA-binding CsgD family transcriptional regulator